jgi:hypothetical protein
MKRSLLIGLPFKSRLHCERMAATLIFPIFRRAKSHTHARWPAQRRQISSAYCDAPLLRHGEHTNGGNGDGDGDGEALGAGVGFSVMSTVVCPVVIEYAEGHVPLATPLLGAAVSA